METKKYEVIYTLKKLRKSMIVIAENKSSAITQVAQKTGGDVLIVKDTKETFEESFQKSLAKFKNTLFKRKIKTKELIFLFKQLAIMVKAGMPITDSLKEANSATKNSRLQYIVEDCIIKIEAGKTFHESLQTYEYEVGQLAVSIIKMGEETGELSEALQDLNRILGEMAHNKARIKKAMKQPMITMVVLIGAMVGLIMGVIPKFKTIFEGLGADLPVPTQILLTLSDYFQEYGFQTLGGLVVLIFVHIKMTALSQRYAYATDSFKLKIPIIKNVIKYGMLSRFLTVFNKLFLAGIPMVQSVNTAINTVDNLKLKKKLEEIEYNISKGESLAKILEQTKLFVNMDIQMIKAGEEAGDLSPMLNSVSERYKEEFEEIVDNLSSLIEPILLLIVAAMVLLLALGIFLPMWNMGSAVKGK